MTKLVKALDKATEQNTKCEMGSFVVYLSGDEKLESKLKDLAQKEGLKKIVLSIESPEGPAPYKISKDADVTVLLYTERTVKANKPITRTNLRDAIQATKLGSIQGPIAFDANGDILTRTVSIYQWRDGEIKYVSVAPEK